MHPYRQSLILKVIIAFSAVVWLGTDLYAQGVHAQEAITIFGNSRKPPKNYLENEKAKGILVEMMRWVEKESGQKFTINLFPWKRAYANATMGQGGIIGLSMTQERLKIFDYSEVMYYDDMMLVTLTEKKFAYNSLQDLKGKRVACLRGASFGDEFEKGIKDKVFTPVEVNFPHQGFHLLMHDRADVVLIGPGKIGVYKALDSDPELAMKKRLFTILDKPFKRDPNYLGFAKTMNKAEYLKTFNATIKKGWDSGAFQKIIDSYETEAK